MIEDATPVGTRELAIGIVGFGQRAGLWRYAHRPDHPTLPSRVTIICDVSERGRADALKKLPEAEITDDLDRLLESGIDAVLVTTPDDQHFPVAMKALRAGVAVFCEKPLATTIEHCDTLLQTAMETGTRLYVGHNMRHMPMVRQMRDLITSGRIGEVKAIWCRHFVGHGGDFYFKDWHAERAKSTGLLLQKGAHDIDVIHWLAGGYTRSTSAIGTLAVYGGAQDPGAGGYLPETGWSPDALTTWPPSAQTGINPAADVEDLSMMLMTLDNGVLASYQQCHFTPDYWRSYTVIGDAGRLECFGNGPGGEIRVWNTRKAGYAAEGDLVVPIPDVGGGHGGADPSIVEEFLGYVRHGGATLTSVVAAREAVAAGCAATESLRSGGVPVAVPPPPA
jgi:predicted dehydrogenase